jgi:hypothetical protein
VNFDQTSSDISWKEEDCGLSLIIVEFGDECRFIK